MHITRSHKQRKWHDSTPDKDTRNEKRKELQQKLAHVVVRGDDTDSPQSARRNRQCLDVQVYLGSRFRTDAGCHLVDIKERITVAMKTAGQVHNIFEVKNHPTQPEDVDLPHRSMLSPCVRLRVVESGRQSMHNAKWCQQ